MTTSCRHDAQHIFNVTQSDRIERHLERQRQEIALRLASPHRAPTGRPIASQADAGHLPLFAAADEPRLI